MWDSGDTLKSIVYYLYNDKNILKQNLRVAVYASKWQNENNSENSLTEKVKV
jgi:hypothetical protein